MNEQVVSVSPLSWSEQFKVNLIRFWGFATTWANWAFAALWTYWVTMAPEAQAALVGQVISPSKVPYVLGVLMVLTHAAAKGTPQPVHMAKVQEKKIEAVIQANYDNAAPKQ